MSTLYQLFTQYSALPKVQQEQKISVLRQNNPRLAKQLESLLPHSKVSFDDILQNLQQSFAVQNETELRMGRLINNKYQIKSLLGQGGMSDVYLAKRIDGLIEHNVAIKYFALADSHENALSMIKKEAQLLANLDHQFIASFIDIGLDNHQEPNIMMEYIDGITLYQFLQSQPSEHEKNKVNETLKIAIEHANSKGIEHGDLSKNNVLVDREGNANIVDFDIANCDNSIINDRQSLCV
jgi:serine/threonine-protein kinase